MGAMRLYNPADFLSEDDWQAQVIAAARLLGWAYYHTRDSRRSPHGFPDLVLSRPPRLVFAELKRERGQPTAEQYDWLERLRTSGQEAYCWWPSQWEGVARVLKGGCMDA